MLPKTEEEFSNCCFQNWTGSYTIFHFTEIACSVLVKLDQKLGTPRKQIPKSSQEQEPRAAFVCQLGWLGIQECPRGSSNPPWVVFSLEQRFRCHCWEGQSAQGTGWSPIQTVSTLVLLTINKCSCSSDCPCLEKCNLGRETGRSTLGLVLFQVFESCSDVGNNKNGNQFILRVQAKENC